MWKVVKLEIENLLTHKYTVYKPVQGKATMITGENWDDLSQKSNGSGKSALIEGFSMGLLGTSLKGIRNVDLICDNPDVKSACVALDLENSFTNETMTIIRVFPKKDSAKLTLQINGIDVKDQFATTPEGDKLILRKLGISKEDLLGYFLISKKRYKSFYIASDTIKKEIIARFSGADMLSGIEGFVDANVVEIETRKRKLEDDKLKTETEVGLYETELKTEKVRDIKDEKKKKIEEVEAKNVETNRLIKEKNNQNELLKERIKTCNTDIKGYGEEITKTNKKIEGIKIDSLLQKVKRLEEGITVIRKNANTIDKDTSETKKSRTEYEKFIAEVDVMMAGVVECPKCKYEFSVSDDDMDVKAVRDTKSQAEKEVERLTGVVDKLSVKHKTELEKITTTNKTITTAEKMINGLKIEKSNLESDNRMSNNSINTAEQNIERHKNSQKINSEAVSNYQNNIIERKKRIKEIEQEKIETKVKEYEKKIKDGNKKIEVIDKDIEIIDKELYEETQWKYNFTRFNSFLANKAISSIAGLTNHNLEKSKTDLRVRIEGFKVLADKSIREKISTHALRSGVDIGLLEKLSGGEQARIEAATIVSLQKLINNSSSTGGLDLLMIDEILDAMDEGIELILYSLDRLGQTIGIITHVNSGVTTFPNITKIVKKDGISKILA